MKSADGVVSSASEAGCFFDRVAAGLATEQDRFSICPFPQKRPAVVGDCRKKSTDSSQANDRSAAVIEVGQ